jgi:hypothetical protein
MIPLGSEISLTFPSSYSSIMYPGGGANIFHCEVSGAFKKISSCIVSSNIVKIITDEDS